MLSYKFFACFLSFLRRSLCQKPLSYWFVLHAVEVRDRILVLLIPFKALSVKEYPVAANWVLQSSATQSDLALIAPKRGLWTGQNGLTAAVDG